MALKMEPIEGSETSGLELRRRLITQKKTYYIKEHGESLKSRNRCFRLALYEKHKYILSFLILFVNWFHTWWWLM